MKNDIDKLKKIAVKFLIEDFYYKEKQIGQNQNSMAVAIDKIQTFYFVLSHHFDRYQSYLMEGTAEDRTPKIHTQKQGIESKATKRFLKFLREQRYDQLYDSEKIEGVFSSKNQINIFDAICKNGEADLREPAQRVLAFQLSDSLLEKFEVLEYAVLEGLFYKSNGVDHWSKADVNLQKSFSKKFDRENDTQKRKSIQEVIKNYSQSEIDSYFRRLREPKYIVDYFIYQKRTGYPLINHFLYEYWIEEPMWLIRIFVESITKLLRNKQAQLIDKYESIFNDTENQIAYLDKKLKRHADRQGDEEETQIKYRTNEISQFVINKYFPYHFYKGKNRIASLDQFLMIYSDEFFRKNIVCPNNDLRFLIFQIFSHLNLEETFGICASRGCTRKPNEKVFVKYPKPDRKFCSNKCAAYEGVCKSRELQKTDAAKNNHPILDNIPQ